jgi:hypothetical protein
MPLVVFDFSFEVDASLEAVAALHHDTKVLHALTPPLILLRVHRSGPMAEGMEAEFTMWMGPLPLKWHVIHVDVSPRGFTDKALAGPCKSWRHRHRFVPLDEGGLGAAEPGAAEPASKKVRIEEHVELEHDSGPWGWLTRALFARPNLWILFMYRRWQTRRLLRSGAFGGGRDPRP